MKNDIHASPPLNFKTSPFAYRMTDTIQDKLDGMELTTIDDYDILCGFLTYLTSQKQHLDFSKITQHKSFISLHDKTQKSIKSILDIIQAPEEWVTVDYVKANPEQFKPIYDLKKSDELELHPNMSALETLIYKEQLTEDIVNQASKKLILDLIEEQLQRLKALTVEQKEEKIDKLLQKRKQAQENKQKYEAKHAPKPGDEASTVVTLRKVFGGHNQFEEFFDCLNKIGGISDCVELEDAIACKYHDSYNTWHVLFVPDNDFLQMQVSMTGAIQLPENEVYVTPDVLTVTRTIQTPSVLMDRHQCSIATIVDMLAIAIKQGAVTCLGACYGEQQGLTPQFIEAFILQHMDLIVSREQIIAFVDKFIQLLIQAQKLQERELNLFGVLYRNTSLNAPTITHQYSNLLNQQVNLLRSDDSADLHDAATAVQLSNVNSLN